MDISLQENFTTSFNEDIKYKIMIIKITLLLGNPNKINGWKWQKIQKTEILLLFLKIYNEVTPENIPMPNSSILVSYIITSLTLPRQLFHLYPKSNYLIVIKILQVFSFHFIYGCRSTMMKWMQHGLFKIRYFRVMGVLSGDSGGFVW